jgi:hypothetical protein
VVEWFTSLPPDQRVQVLRVEEPSWILTVAAMASRDLAWPHTHSPTPTHPPTHPPTPEHTDRVHDSHELTHTHTHTHTHTRETRTRKNAWGGEAGGVARSAWGLESYGVFAFSEPPPPPVLPPSAADKRQVSGLLSLYGVLVLKYLMLGTKISHRRRPCCLLTLVTRDRY